VILVHELWRFREVYPPAVDETVILLPAPVLTMREISVATPDASRDVHSSQFVPTVKKAF
jgi:hypothetical protein